MPALLTSTSMRPNSATVASIERGALVPVADVAAHRQRPPADAPAPRRRPTSHGLELAARHDDVGARLREPERHRAAQALAASGDDDDLAGRVELGMVIDASVPRLAGALGRRGRQLGVTGDALDHVSDVEFEQRVRLVGGRRLPGRRPAERAAGRGPVASTPPSTAPNPTVAHMSSRHACTAASACEAVASHRLDERPRRLHVCVASRPEDEPAVSRAAQSGCGARGPSARPYSSHGSSSLRRRRQVGEQAVGDRVERVRPCCRSGCRAEPATRRAGRRRCACSPRRARTPGRSRPRR